MSNRPCRPSPARRGIEVCPQAKRFRFAMARPKTGFSHLFHGDKKRISQLAGILWSKVRENRKKNRPGTSDPEERKISMSNEFDYSGLYHNNDQNSAPNGTPDNAAPNSGAAENTASNAAQSQPAGQSQPQGGSDGSYPNVGSSGMNTANTARTDYSSQQAGQQSQAQSAQADGYTSTMHGGGSNGYNYTSAPSQPPKKKKKGNGKKIALRIVAAVCVVALGFGSGFAGAIVAARTGLAGNTVVMQTVDRQTSENGTQGSAGGTALSTQDVASLVSPSVVVITTEQMVSSNNLWFGGSYVQSGAGSGVIISEDGYILTCAHVVNGATNVKVQLNGSDTQYDATVVGLDTASDIAVIKIEATGLTPAVIGDSDKLAVGEEVIAVGNPLGTLGGTVTNGIISALNRQITVENNQMTLIQTNAAVSPGNSGGGLFNANGELVGIVNAKSDDSSAEGLGFAIPINSAVSIAQELISTGYVARPALGVTVITIQDAQTAMQYGVSNYGVYIISVSSGSGAEAAGLKQGDRIVSVGDTVVSSSNDVTSYIQNMNVGDVVSLQVERDGKLMSFDVTLGQTSAAQ